MFPTMITTSNLPLIPIFTTVLALILVFIIFKAISRSKRLNLPPGPPGWPLVGNLFQIALSGKDFVHYVRQIGAIYGPIFTLRLGSRTMIYIYNADLAHEALIEKGQIFGSRPPENATRTIFSSNKFTVNAALYGPEWRSLRRNIVSGMLSNARLREFRPLRLVAMDRFINHIRSEAESSDGAVSVLKNVRFAIFSILLSMCFGLDLDEKSIGRVDEALRKVLITLMPRMDDYLPLLKPFFAKQRKQTQEVRKFQVDTIVPLIKNRRAILENPKDYPDAAPFSYLDSILDLKVEGRDTVPTEDDELVSLCSEFMNGGADTTATGLEWAVARIIQNPEMQARIYEEILAVAGDRPVDEAETEKMTFLQAFVKEVLRKHPPTYFSLSHAGTETAKVGGYDIPAGANLEIFYPAISEDPHLWKNPKEFDPERFLTGGETADITGSKGIRMIPFGAGRRICPGLNLAMIHISLIIARMVQAFEWRAHPTQTPMDFGENFEFTIVMRTPLLAVVKERKM